MKKGWIKPELEEFVCEFPEKYGTLKLEGKTYLVGLTDVERTIEHGRVRHIFILTEVI